MPFNGSGTFNRVYNWVNDRVNGIKILATRMDTEMNGFATGLSTCITKDGQTTVTADLPMGGFKHTGVADAVALTEYASFGQIRNNPYYYAAGGSANTYTIAPSPAYSAYATGLTFDVKIADANTGASTLNVNGLGAKAIKMPDGSDVPSGGLAAGTVAQLLYDGTVFRVVGGAVSGITQLTGDVTASGSGSVAATIANNAVTTAKIIDNAVTLPKLSTQAANTILANATGSTASPTAVAIAANKFPARSSAGDFAAKDITDFALTLLDDADAATARTTLGIGGGLVYSGATAYSGAQPTTYTDLDLSSIVGTNRAWVTLRITGDANSNIFFRTKGETLDAYGGLGSNASLGSGTSGTSMSSTSVGYISLLTNTSGIVQWRSNISSTTTVVTVLTYMVTS